MSCSCMLETGLLCSVLPSSCLGFPTALPVMAEYRKQSGGQAGAAGTSRALSAAACSVGGSRSDGRRDGNHFRRRPGSGFLRSPLLRGGGESARLLQAPVPCTLARRRAKPLLCWRDIRPGKLGDLRGVKFPAQVAPAVLPCRGGACPPGDPQPQEPLTPLSCAMKSEQEESKPGTCCCEHGFAPCPAYCSGPWGRQGAAGDDARGRVLCPCLAHAGKGGFLGVLLSCTVVRGGMQSGVHFFPLLALCRCSSLPPERNKTTPGGWRACLEAHRGRAGGWLRVAVLSPHAEGEARGRGEGLLLPHGGGEGGRAAPHCPVVHFVSWRSWSVPGAHRGLGGRFRRLLRRLQPTSQLLLNHVCFESLCNLQPAF